MPFAEHFMLQGTFTVPEVIPTTVKVNTGFIPTRVELINMSSITRLAGGPPTVNPTANYQLYSALWQTAFSSAAIPFTLVQGIAPSENLKAINAVIANGISPYDGHAASPNSYLTGPAIAGSNTAKATGTFTVTSTATLYPGAVILMTGNTVNKQLGGMLFTVDTVASGTTFTIANAGWLNTANFTDGAEVFAIRLVTVPSLYYPANAQIVSISQANPAVITTSVNMGLTVGQQVRLYVPRIFGMTQANLVQGIISAVSGNQITLGGVLSVDSSAYTAFAWPAATSVPFSPAYVVPVGSGPSPVSTPPFYNVDVLDDATTNIAFQGFVVGSGILQADSTTVFGVDAGDVFAWTAWRADV